MMRSAIQHEFGRAPSVAPTDQVRHTEFCIRINCHPRPDIAPTLLLLLRRNGLFLGSHKGPNLVALETLDAEIAHIAVMVRRSRTAQVSEQVEHGLLRNARHPAGCIYGDSLD